MRRAAALATTAALALGCLREARPLRCDRAGDTACDLAPGSRCVGGYCARADTACPSGYRYASSALTPGACTMTVDAGAPREETSVDATGTEDVADATAPDDLVDVPDEAADVVDLDVSDAPFDAGVDLGAELGTDVSDDRGPPPDGGLSPPMRFYPPSGARSMSTTPTFSLRRVQAMSNVQIEICRSRVCAFTLVTTISLPPSLDTYTQPTPLAPGLYWWRARSEGGGATSDWTPAWPLVIPPRGRSTGLAWGLFPDVNGDGLADLAMSLGPPGSATPDRELVLLGGVPQPKFDTVVTLPRPGAPPQGYGGRVVMAGDVNGDGLCDVAVSGSRHSAAGAGAAHLFVTNPSGALGSPTVITLPNTSPRFGELVSPAGNFHRNGLASIAVGDPGQGTLHVLGYALTTGRVAEMFRPEVRFPGMFNIVGGGDVDGDGSGDVAVAHDGGVSVVLGGASTGMIRSIRSDAGAVNFGATMSLQSDVNGDGLADLVVGAPGGRAWVYSLSPATPVQIDGFETSAPPGSFFGVGDANGDGLDEVVLVIQNYIFARVPTRATPFTADTRGIEFQGFSGAASLVAPAADYTGDGVPDVLVAWRSESRTALQRFALPVAAGSFSSVPVAAPGYIFSFGQ